ncbi:MAG: hypothetical protein ACLPN5_11425 [Roseiarcus sp.]
MSIAVFLHMLAAFVWLGSVLTEWVFERAGDGSDADRLYISRAHWRIDLFVETPAFALVLLTGLYLFGGAPPTALVGGMVGAGLVAVGFNIYRSYLVYIRLKAAEAGDFERWLAIDHQHNILGAVVLIAMLIALAIGASLFTAS